MFRDGKWKPATVVQKLSKPRSYIVKAGNGCMYQRNRSKLLKTNRWRSNNWIKQSDDQTVRWSNNQKIKQSEDQTIRRSNNQMMTVKLPEIINIKIEDESYMTNQEEQPENNTEVRTRSGRISSRPKQFEDYETF